MLLCPREAHFVTGYVKTLELGEYTILKGIIFCKKIPLTLCAHAFKPSDVPKCIVIS